mgnify:CR=1 FL=1
MLENVQIRATKMIDGFNNLDYEERLRRLKLPTLVYRRARGDMIEVWKHFHTYNQSYQDMAPNLFGGNLKTASGVNKQTPFTIG